MTVAAADRLAAVLGGIEAPGSFSARRTAAVGDLRLEVEGVGQILLPVPREQAQKLYLLGRPARFGRRNQTLVDRLVRDTQEVPKARVKIDKRQWNKTLLPVLDQLRGDIGLPSGCRLRAELHSMLVYGRGQFFVPHQDSETADEMIGSLVVTLPSAHSGGALAIEHAGRVATYRPSKTALTFVAFYSDCRHQVKPVTSGYRVALTYNLLIRGDMAVPGEIPAVSEELAACLREHFATPVAPPYGAGEARLPSRLVYLLDHEYTERGLSWVRLKGSDSRRAALVRAAAARAGCETVLALAEVHETWTAYEAGWDDPWYDRRRRWDGKEYYEDEADEDAPWAGASGSTDPDDYELQELIDSSVQLGCWLDPAAATAERISLRVDDAEVCETTKSIDLNPYSSEYEGYMGNYGNTMDRWYRRAAVVLWPSHLDFAVRAEASARWALEALARRIRHADVASAQDDAAILEPFWNAAVYAQDQNQLLASALEVARGLEEPSLGAMLLAPFRIETLSRAHSEPLAGLVACYGEQWTGDLLQAWSSRGDAWMPGAQDRRTWLASLADLTTALQAAGGSGTIAAKLLTLASWRWLSTEMRKGLAVTAPSRREEALRQLGGPLAKVLESAALTESADLRDEIVGACCRGDGGLLTCLITALRSVTELAPATRTAAGLDTIACHCAGVIEARLAYPLRAADDWSVELPAGCSCELCEKLARFLSDAGSRSLEWPLRQDRRHHVHSRIDAAELPVRHQTRRTGRPYTLVLAKTQELFDREQNVRDSDESDLGWLRAAYASFPA